MLARIRKSMEEKDQGFTLIELLVVIIIIGILAAIAIPVFLNQRKKGWDAQAQSDARNLATLEETAFTNSTTAPATYLLSTDLASTKAALTDYKSSANVTNVVIQGYDTATPQSLTTSQSSATGGYCIDVTSNSGKHFFYNSTKGGMQPASTTAC